MHFLAAITEFLFIAIHLIGVVGLIAGLCLISRQNYEQRLKWRRIAEIKEPLPLPLSMRTAEAIQKYNATTATLFIQSKHQLLRKLLSEPVRQTQTPKHSLKLNLSSQPPNPR